MAIEQHHHNEPAKLIGTLPSPDVERETKTRPRNCPYCKGTIMQRWGRVTKPVRDTRVWNKTLYHIDAANADVGSDIILKVLTGLTRDCV